MFAGSFNSLSLIIADVVGHNNKNAFCNNTIDNPGVSAAISFAQFALLFIAPLVAITVLYTAIAIALKRWNRALTDNAQNLQRHSEKKRKQAVRMTVTIVALFYICVIPLTLLYFAPYWRLSCASQRLFYSLASFAFCLSSMVNPIICLSFVESYRRGLQNTLCPGAKMQDKMTANRRQVALEEVENLSGENSRRVLKDTEQY